MSTSLRKVSTVPAERRVSPELQRFLAAPDAVGVSTRTVHQSIWWNFGVNLMNNLRFKAKILIITCMFILPLALISWFYYSSMLDQIQFSAQERLGVEYNNEVIPLIDLAQQLRRDAVVASVGTVPATMETVKDRLTQAQGRLADVNKRLGSTLGTASAYAKVEATYAAAIASTGDGVFNAHTEHVAALIALLGNVTDNSNLTLDPDIASFYVMDAVYARMPDVVENSGKLRGLGLKVLKSGTITPVQLSALSELIPVAEFQFGNMRDDLGKAIGNDKTLAEQVNINSTMDSSAAFFALARKTVIGSQDFSAEAQTNYLAAANKAIDDQYVLAKRLAGALDGLLAKRIDAMKATLYMISAVILVGLALAAYFFYSFFLAMDGGLKLISHHLNELAEGDLRSKPAPAKGKDETADVIGDLRQTYDALHALIRTVRHSARALHATSSEIAAASLDLSGRTEAAAASLEEQAAAMEEIGSTVGNTASKAKMAASFAVDNAKVAAEGGHVIGTVVQTMENINASSAKISDIISVIDGIAFQTNILALNAAVEAARAGESGRGFAVVASEVRSLAHRSADAAREIKALISHSVDQISSGTAVVEKAGLTMNTMVSNAEQISQYLNDISTAANEQSVGVAEVGSAIQALDEQTQQNAALVEETSAASGALTQQAEALQQEIASFRVA